ncbi:MBL fold metallo-hydrolase [Alicyclobacillus dauci]|uniref:MBL fold metallo-hydrolase n=1 Tax=Alicyclobacillus dauci TaxID=1475485 RepID=A0ABY6Z7U3_9BACL|nr:MBL fold metallo-hydrolase [Alicyclobacillus dauci]WAH38897.1 MBL fold metallo-hydrolase [Alicyclobacillus dauci]
MNMLNVTSRETVVTQIEVPTPYAIGTVNMYLLQREGFVVLVDAGVDTDEAWDIFTRTLRENGLQVNSLDAIVLTHHHDDHVGIVNRILQRKAIPVFVHPRSVVRLTRDAQYLECRLQFFDSLYERMGFGDLGRQRIDILRRNLHNEDQLRLPREALTPVGDDSTVPVLPGVDFYYTPGHAVDHFVLYDEHANWLFSGDLLLPHVSSNAIVEPDERTWRRLHTVSQMRESLRLCLDLPAQTVFPGHGEPFSQLQSLAEYRLNRIDGKAERIIHILENGPHTAAEVCQKMYPTKLHTEFYLVASEVVGLLDYLADVGKVSVSHQGAYDVWETKVAD